MAVHGGVVIPTTVTITKPVHCLVSLQVWGVCT